jgi:uncharacterized protein YggE
MQQLLIALAVLFVGGRAATESQAPRVTVTGTGKVRVAPDIAHTSVSVVSQAQTAAEAWQKNRTLVQKLFRVLDEHEIAARDRETVNLDLAARYTYSKDQEPRIAGYTGTYGLSGTVRKLDDLGKVLDDLVAAGANRGMNISFGYDKPEEVLGEARARAVADARRKAELYAQCVGATLGPVQSLTEEQAAPPRPITFERAAIREGGATPLPVATGEQELTVKVRITYHLSTSR